MVLTSPNGSRKPALKWTLPLLAGAGVLVATLYSSLVRPSYEASGTALIKRTALDYPGGAGEEAKNRWVWVRDGLALKAELTADERLRDIIANIPELAARRTAFAASGISRQTKVASLGDADLLFAQELRRQLTVIYTGGDENIYEVRARDQDPDVARALAAALLSEVGKMTEGQGATAAQSALQALAEKARVAREEGASQGDFVEESRSLLAEYYDHFTAKADLQAATDKDRFRILSHPVAAVQVWPRPLASGLVAAAFGIFAALVLDLWMRRRLESSPAGAKP